MFDLSRLLIGLTLSLVVAKNIDSDLWSGLFFVVSVLSVTGYIKATESSVKRPEWVWVLFIVFSLVAISSIHDCYQLYRGLIPLPDNIALSSSTQYYIENIADSVLQLAATITLFLRVSASRWLWLAMVFCFFLKLIYSLLNADIYYENLLPLGYATYIIFGVAQAAIAYYVFKLKQSGYYTTLEIKEEVPTSSEESCIEPQRPIWLTLALLLYGFFIIPLAFITITSPMYLSQYEFKINAIIIGSHSLLALSIFGIWKLKMWGISAGVMGILLITARLGYLGESFAILPIFMLGLFLYIFVFFWLRINKDNASYEN